MTKAQTGLGKGQPRHSGRNVHIQPHAFIPGKGGFQQGRCGAERICRECVSHGVGVCAHPGFQCVGQNVETAVGNQCRGQLREKFPFQNGHFGAEFFIYKGVFYPVMGQNGKIRHFRAGAGGGGNGNEGDVQAAEISHGLGTVHGTSAAESHHAVGAELLQLCRSLCHQLHRGVGHDFVENFVRIRHFSQAFCPAIFGEKRIGNDHQPLKLLPGNGRDHSGTHDDLGFTGKFLHKIPPFALIPSPGGKVSPPLVVTDEECGR